MEQELIRGHLDSLILAVLEDGPLHGYAIIQQLHQRSDGSFALPEGTVYPALHRLERAGLLESGWSEDAPRRRRVYRLSRSGRSALADMRARWRAFARRVDAVLGAPA